MSAPPSVRQSTLAQFDKCAYAGKLALEQGQADEDSLPSHATNRGTLFHMAAEVAALEGLARREAYVSGDVARTIAQDVIAQHPELPVPTSEHEAIRLMAWNWGESFELPDPEAVVLVERKIVLDIRGQRVHGTPDLVEWVEPGVVQVTDYKTSLAVVTQEEYERKFQPQFYAMLVAHGAYEDTGEKVVSRSLRAIRTREVYPRYRGTEGYLVSRVAEYNQEQIADFMVAVESIVGRLHHGLESGEWAAVPGNHCGYCPKPQACPLRENEWLGNMPVSPENATELARRWHALDEEKKAAFKALRAYADEHGSISLNDTHELAFKLVEQEEVRDKDGLKSRLVEGGEDLASHFKKRTSTRFGLRKKEHGE